MLSKFILALFVLALALPAQEPKPKDRPRRLEHVLWNPVDLRLSWVISTGSIDSEDTYHRDGALDSYVIDFRQRTMEHKGETRRIEHRDAAEMIILLDRFLSQYAAGSTIWWEDGKGEPVEPPGRQQRTE